MEFSFILCRPLWVEFPGEEDTFAVEHQYMIGEEYLSFLYVFVQRTH